MEQSKESIPDKEEIEDGQTLGVSLEKSDVYPLDEIRIEKKSFSLFEIKRQEDKKRITINPSFQRKSVWSQKQKSELIESILMRLPIPIFYFYQTKDGNIRVVDGRQRIEAIIEYMRDEFRLTELNIINDFKGKKFSELEGFRQRLIEDYSIDVYLIQPPTPLQVVYDIFDRVNRGGTQLNKQEMRNALHQGNATELLEKLSQDKNFKELTGFPPEGSKRMKDHYLILRFLGFYLFYSQHKYKQVEGIKYVGKIDIFLADIMERINKMDDNQIEELANLFQKTMEYIHQHYDEDLFRFASNDNKKRPVNMLLFESLCYLFVVAQEKNLLIPQEQIKELKIKFDSSEKFAKGIDGVQNVQYRFEEGIKYCLQSNDIEDL